MKLSQENIKTLSNCAENKVRLIVTGKNGFGQEFSTEGYILSGIDVKGQPKWVSDRGFGLFVGQTRKDNMGEDFELFVPLYSYAIDDEYYKDTLYIQNVLEKESGKIVYTNPDFDTIINNSLMVQKSDDICKEWLNKPLSKYAQRLSSLIGKPVIHTDSDMMERVVIKMVHMSKNANIVKAVATDGYLYRGLTQLQAGEIKIDKKAYRTLDKYSSTHLEKEKNLLSK